VQNLLEKASDGLGVSDGAGDPLIELVVVEPLPVPKGQPLVKDWDCLRVRFDCNTYKSLHLQSMCLLVRLVPQVLLCTCNMQSMSCLSHITRPHQFLKGASQNVACCSFWCDIVTLMGCMLCRREW